MNAWILAGTCVLALGVGACERGNSRRIAADGSVRALSILHLGPEDRQMPRLVLAGAAFDPGTEHPELADGVVVRVTPLDLAEAAKAIEDATKGAALADPAPTGAFEFMVIRSGGVRRWSLTPDESDAVIRAITAALTEAVAREALQPRLALTERAR